MPSATVGRLRLEGLVPRGLGARPAVALERALGAPFGDAVDAAFASLADVDPGALWVLRRLDVSMDVPASEPDAVAQSRRVATGLALAVQRAVAAGPSAEAVRFTSRADHVAAYVRSRTAGHGTSWVFDRFASLGPLPPADALVAAARVAEADLLDVVAELVGSGGWSRLTASATPDERGRLVGSLGRRVDGVTAPADALAAVARARRAALSSATSGHAPPPASGPLARLALLAEVAGERPLDAGLVAAVWQLEPDAPPRRAATTGSVWPVVRDGRPSAVTDADGPATGARPTAAVGPGTPGPRVFAAAGAAAFLLLPDLAALVALDPRLAASSPAAAAVRATVLAGVLGARVDDDDPGVALAAGLARPPEAGELAAFVAGPVSAWAERLAADPVLGWRHPLDVEWVGRASARDPALGVASVALLRSFTRHLPGFAEARAAHVLPQVLPPGGVVRVDGSRIEAVLPTGPLHVLLALAGLDAVAVDVPWLDAGVLVTHEVSSWTP